VLGVGFLEMSLWSCGRKAMQCGPKWGHPRDEGVAGLSIQWILNHLAGKGLPGLWSQSRAPPARPVLSACFTELRKPTSRRAAPGRGPVPLVPAQPDDRKSGRFRAGLTATGHNRAKCGPLEVPTGAKRGPGAVPILLEIRNRGVYISYTPPPSFSILTGVGCDLGLAMRALRATAARPGSASPCACSTHIATSNHVLLLLKDRGRGKSAGSMQLIAGRAGRRMSEFTEQGLLYLMNFALFRWRFLLLFRIF